jgi:hypothetical protein
MLRTMAIFDHLIKFRGAERAKMPEFSPEPHSERERGNHRQVIGKLRFRGRGLMLMLTVKGTLSPGHAGANGGLIPDNDLNLLANARLFLEVEKSGFPDTDAIYVSGTLTSSGVARSPWRTAARRPCRSGTANPVADAGGVIQFVDPQPTNRQRFYRFGQ